MRVFNEILGDYLDIPTNPRIVSLAPSNTDILFHLDVWDNVVGISQYCRIPNGMGEKPRIGSYISVNYRKLDELNPDIIFTTTGVQRKLSLTMWKKGYPVYPIPLPLSIYGILENIIVTGSVLNRVEKAYEQAQYYLKVLNEIPRPRENIRVYYEVDLGGPITIGSLSYINSSLNILGLTNIFGEVPRSYFEPDMDTVARRDPQLIIYETSNEDGVDVNELLSIFMNRGWDRVKAVRDRNILVLPRDSLAHYGPSHFLTLKEIAGKVIEIL